MKLGLLFALTALVLLPAMTSGCPQAAPAVAPALSCVEKVLADALAGLSIDEIAAKEGPSCASDAAEVAEILLGSADPNVQGTPAYKAALGMRDRREIRGDRGNGGK